MSFIIRFVGKAVARRIESGSTKGATLGAVSGAVLLGGLAGLGWVTGTTGYLGFGLTLAGTLCGVMAGALVGAGIGPADQLIHSEGQQSITVSDLNRKLAPLVPLVICVIISVGSLILWYQEKSTLSLSQKKYEGVLMVSAISGLIAIVIGYFLSRQDLSVTLGDSIRINRLLGRTHYSYEQIEDWRLVSRETREPPFPPGEELLLVLHLPGRKVQIPVKAGQGDDLYWLLGGMTSQ